MSHVLPEALLYQTYGVSEVDDLFALRSTLRDMHLCTVLVNTCAAFLACFGAMPWNELPTDQVRMVFANVLQGSMNSMRALFKVAGSGSTWLQHTSHISSDID